MRQVGVIAAAGLYAIHNNIERLALDHQHAKKIAEGIFSQYQNCILHDLQLCTYISCSYCASWQRCGGN